MDDNGVRMYDIHTKKEIQDDDEKYDNSISPERMKIFVFNEIDFVLTDHQWYLIDGCFADYWNNKIGVGGYFYWDEVTNYIYSKFMEGKELIPYERVKLVVELMLGKIEKDGGFMDL